MTEGARPEDPDADEIREQLEARKVFLERSKKALEDRLRDLMEDMRGKRKIRTRLTEARVKNPESLIAKAMSKGWSIDQTLSAGDIIGARIVCNNTQDIAEVCDVIRGCTDLSVLEDDTFSPLEGTGYGAVHLAVSINVPKDQGVESVLCEVQVRTVLQDSWAVLSHDDIYKDDLVPDYVSERFRLLALQLHAVQGLADQVRSELSQVPRHEDAVSFLQLSEAVAADDIETSGVLELQWEELAELASEAADLDVELADIVGLLSNKERKTHIKDVLGHFIQLTAYDVVLAAAYSIGSGDDGLVDFLIARHRDEFISQVEESTNVGSCSYCQPYDGGEAVWVVGKHYGLFGEFVAEVLSSEFGLDSYTAADKVANELDVRCDGCGADATPDLEIGFRDDDDYDSDSEDNEDEASQDPLAALFDK